MNRHEMRVKVMISTYQHLLTSADIFSCLENNMGKEKADGFIKRLIKDIAINEDAYIRIIDEQLKDWTFDRLGRIEQAILLMSVAEIVSNENDKAVVINEAITLAKLYADEESYRIINGTLDSL